MKLAGTMNDVRSFMDLILSNMNTAATDGWWMSCPCGRGDFSVCKTCPYRNCPVHGG